MNKKVLLLCFFAVCISSVSIGQGIRYGFKLGLNVSQISSFSSDIANLNGNAILNPSSSFEDSRFGFAASFIAEFPINDKLSFQPEFGYATQGNKAESVRYENLILPLALKINFNKLFVNIGPQASLKISAFEQSDNFKSFDFSGFGGIGYKFTENIFIEARYTIGFIEVFEDGSFVPLAMPSGNAADGITPNVDNIATNLSGNNSFFTLSIGYQL